MAKILLIDDYAELRTLVKRIVELDGHEVTIAGSGRIVTHNIADKSFGSAIDRIIAGIVTPDVDGIETIKLLKIANPKARVIAMSNSRHTAVPDSYLQIARQMGADPTIAQPFLIADFVTATQTLIATP